MNLYEGVRGYLEAFRRLEGGHTDAGHSLVALLLKHGREWPFQPLPADVEKGRPRECFCNATNLALRYSKRFTYCEGYAINLLPVEHAWCVDREGRVVDPTWVKPNGKPEYFGIPIKTEFLRYVFGELGLERYGLMYAPPLHPLFTFKPSKWKAKI